MNEGARWMVALMFIGAIAVGCGDDDDSGNSKSDAGDGGPVADSGSDAGGQTGTGGTTGGTGGSMMTAMGVKCGSTTCMPPGGGLLPAGFGGTACCVDEDKGTCGTMMGGMCMPPPPVDPSCPSIMIPIIGSIGSCCANNGMCGLDGSLLSMGCIDYDMVTKSLGVLGGVITLPKTQKCGGEDNDAGSSQGDLDAGH